MATFFLVKYRIKALPLVVIIGFLGLVSMFYIPAVKNKMFINPNVVTITDFLTNNVDENNIQTNMRKFMWEEATKQFYDGREITGSAPDAYKHSFIQKQLILEREDSYTMIFLS